jgi:cobalt/nickel transport system permease protein
VALAVLHSVGAASAGLLCSGVLGLLSGRLLSLSSVRKILGVNLFLVFIWLFMPFSFGDGEAIWRVMGLTATREGLDLSILISLKALSITLGAASILGGSSVYTILIGTRALGLPEKIVALMLLMSRYIQVVGDEYRRLRNAMRIRGFTPRLSAHSLKSLANLCGMLLVRGFERADRVLSAMLCRGYTGRFWLRPRLRLGGGDLAFLILFLALTLAVELKDVQ